MYMNIKNYLPIRRGGPTWRSISELPPIIEFTEGKDAGNDRAGNTSGINTPVKPTTIEPLMKSCINCFFIYSLFWYLEATKLNIMKRNPPIKIQGNQVGIIIVLLREKLSVVCRAYLFARLLS
jgi:hypothetical protein